MTRRFIDISMPLENEVTSDPRPYTPKITCFNHHRSYEQMAPFFPGLDKEDWILGQHGGSSSVRRSSRVPDLPWRSPRRGRK